MRKILSIICVVMLTMAMGATASAASSKQSVKPKNTAWVDYLKNKNCPYHIVDTVAPNGLVYVANVDNEGNPYWYCKEKDAMFVFSYIDYDDGDISDALVLAAENKLFYFILDEDRLIVLDGRTNKQLGEFKKSQINYWHGIRIDGNEISIVFESK